MTERGRSWVTQLSEAESDIIATSRSLEKSFKDASHHADTQRVGSVPDPVRLVRRLTALEIALDGLKKDCEIISQQRNANVRSILEMQLETVSQVQKLADRLDNMDPYSSRDDLLDESWEEIIRVLYQQCATFVRSDR